MPPPSLYAICIEKTCRFLASGVWENCEVNPFSSMPSSIVQGLLSAMLLSNSEVSRTRFNHSRLLLTSGRIEIVNLLHDKCLENYSALFQMLSQGCQNLRTLSLPGNEDFPCRGENTRDEEQTLWELLQKCANLEELHTSVYLNPNDLWNCTKLKRLNLHYDCLLAMDFFSRFSPDLLQRLGSLEVFVFCLPFGYLIYTKEVILSATVTILDNRPDLTSLGFMDPTMALKLLHDRDCRELKTPRRFQLRGSYWPADQDDAQFGYCDMIRIACSSCPQLEFLVMQVRDTGSLEHLKTLKKLNSLDIDFDFCENEYEREFCYLLQEIGAQLVHLRVAGSREVPLNLNRVSGNCPNLKTLLLRCALTAVEPVQPYVNLRNLERLDVRYCDSKSLFFLLSNSLHLKVLFLKHAESFDDNLLHAILRMTSFAELEVVHIYESSLSKSGLTRLVRSAGKLRKISLRSSTLSDVDEVMRCVRGLNPKIACHSVSDYCDLEQEEFAELLVGPCST